jgi:hypothetical protein
VAGFRAIPSSHTAAVGRAATVYSEIFEVVRGKSWEIEEPNGDRSTHSSASGGQPLAPPIFLKVSNIDHRPRELEEHDGCVTVPYRHLPVIESVALPPNAGEASCPHPNNF